MSVSWAPFYIIKPFVFNDYILLPAAPTDMLPTYGGQNCPFLDGHDVVPSTIAIDSSRPLPPHVAVGYGD